jgi:hypothetical protein
MDNWEWFLVWMGFATGCIVMTIFIVGIHHANMYMSRPEEVQHHRYQYECIPMSLAVPKPPSRIISRGCGHKCEYGDIVSIGRIQNSDDIGVMCMCY